MNCGRAIGPAALPPLREGGMAKGIVLGLSIEKVYHILGLSEEKTRPDNS